MVDREVFDRRLARLEELLRDLDHARLYEILTGELGQLDRYAAALSRALRDEV